MKTITTPFAWLLALLFIASGARAGTASAETQIILQAFQVLNVVESGSRKEELRPMMNIRPGDVIEYEARYMNSVSHKSQGVQLTLPVPAGGIQYLPQVGTATPVHSASVDGVRFEPVPLRRSVRQPNGALLVEDVPLAEYRFLRWNLGDLPAGASRVVRARMQLPRLAAAGRS